MMNAFVKRLPRPASPLSRTTLQPPAKRLRTQKGSAVGVDEDDPQSTGDEGSLIASPASNEPGTGPKEDLEDGPGETLFETSLPPVKADQDAIDEYEAETAASRLDAGRWVRGRSSIYVDAFNLALETVLEHESNLFDDKERAVFDAWQALDYEAQYLYVRLFLRKTSAWHRSDRLGYYSDIVDPNAAIVSLQEARELPCVKAGSPSLEEQAASPLQDWSLGTSFTFADSSETRVDTVEEALSLLSLDELKFLAKEAKVKGGNKVQLQRALCLMSSQQVSLMSVGLRRTNTVDSAGLSDGPDTKPSRAGTPNDDDDDAAAAAAATPVPEQKLGARFLDKILAITGPCIRLSPVPFKLFERVHMVFFRSTEWTEKSLTAIILSKISRRNFPEYVVSRSANIFPSRLALLEYEGAMRTQFEVDKILDGASPGEEGFKKVLGIFDDVKERWRRLLREEQRKENEVYDAGEGGYLRRFSAGHAFTRIAHKATYALGRLRQHEAEHSLLTELLQQRLFHLARRGAWYQRKALLEEHYMAELDDDDDKSQDGRPDLEQRRKHWRRIAAATCEQALEDNDCHVIYHYDLQKRLVKLERRLKIPKRLQHDFGHVRLKTAEEHSISGIQVKKRDEASRVKAGRGGVGTKTVWIDEHEGGAECSVEEMCLSHYRSEGWKGYHAEGGIIRTLFAYLFYDVLFLYMPNVFQTAYQTCPLDLHTDAFYSARASEANRRLADIANGGAAELLRAVDAAHRGRRTCVVGLNWDFALDDLVELAECFGGEALAAVCKVVAQEYRQRGGGIPDLVLWRTHPERDVLFAEVKSANDRLSDTQRLWIHVLTAAGVRVALAAAVAREVRIVG